MAKSYAQLQQSLTFDELMRFLDEQFQSLPDHRSGNGLRYELPDVLKGAFAMFSLKSASLLDFKNQSVPEESNLRNLYRIEGEIPCDNQMRGILDQFDPSLLRPLFSDLFNLLSEAGIIREYQDRQKRVIVSVVAVSLKKKTKIHCPSCTTRKLRNGEISYHHAGLAAVMVHPEQKEVFPLDFEPILNQDGAKKNDCERNAAKRLCTALKERYPDLKIILVKELRLKDDQGLEHYFAWTNDLCLSDSAIEINVNYLLYEQTDKKGEITRWTWITSLPLEARTVEKVMRTGRSRWKIENETFNTLKNQGYHFEHNYGHGVQSLATVLALLMFLAFTVDQIQQRCCRFFRLLWKGLGTKAKLWASLRNLFNTIVFKSMEALYRRMASNYRLQIE